MTYQDLIAEWRADREKEDRETKYNPNNNYVGSWIFKYPKKAPFHEFYNRASHYHDIDYSTEKNDTTQANKRMAARIHVDLIIAGIMPYHFKYFLCFFIFWFAFWVLISTIGQLIDKSRAIKGKINGFLGRFRKSS